MAFWLSWYTEKNKESRTDYGLWKQNHVGHGETRVQTSKTDTVLGGGRNRPALRISAATGSGKPKMSFLRTAHASAVGTINPARAEISLHTDCHKNGKRCLAVTQTNHCCKNRFKLCHFMFDTFFIMSRWIQSFNPASRWPFQNSVFLLPINFVSFFQAPEIVIKDE